MFARSGTPGCCHAGESCLKLATHVTLAAPDNANHDKLAPYAAKQDKLISSKNSSSKESSNNWRIPVAAEVECCLQPLFSLQLLLKHVPQSCKGLDV